MFDFAFKWMRSNNGAQVGRSCWVSGLSYADDITIFAHAVSPRVDTSQTRMTPSAIVQEDAAPIILDGVSFETIDF